MQTDGQGARFLGSHLYEYRGTTFDGFITPEHRVRAVQGYDDVRDDDVIVCTFPKAGTHWAADMAIKIMNDGNMEKAAQHYQEEAAYEVEPPAQFDMKKLGGRSLAAPTLASLSQLPSPRVIGTHLQFDMLPQKVQEGRAKVIYVYRDPRDIAVSFWHQVQSINKIMGSSSAVPWDETLETFMQEKRPFGLWSKHFKSYQDARCKRDILALYYENMKEDLRGTVSAMAKYLGKELSDSVIDTITASCTFESAKASNPNSTFVRKGIARGWTTQFTVSQSEQFDTHMDNEIMSLELDIPYWPHSQIAVDTTTFPGKAYKYQGVTFPEITMPFARVKDVYNYDDIRPDDVIIWSIPKSGTHWTSDIAAKVMFNGDLEKANKINLDMVTFEINPPAQLINKSCGPAPLSLKELSDLPSPRIIMTHLPFRMLPKLVQQGKAKIICVERDLRDVAVSMFHHMGEAFGGSIEWEKFFEMFLGGKIPGPTWWSMIRDFQDNKARNNLLNLHYEDAKADLKGTVKKVADFLDKDLDDQAIEKISNSCTFAESKKAKPTSPFIRKGEVGGWKSYFTVHQAERLERKVLDLKLNLNLHV